MPEGYEHLVVRTFLFRLLSFALGPEHTVGSEQFVYWIASDPSRSLAPDVFVRLNTPHPRQLGKWQTWEHGGAPDLAVEIVSPNEYAGRAWEKKLADYHELGIKELVRFDPEAREGERLRVWDRVEGDLVERRIVEDRTPCLTLGLGWTVRWIPSPNRGGEYLGLRLLDEDGRLLRTEEEGTEARIRELEEQLRRAQGGAEPK